MPELKTIEFVCTANFGRSEPLRILGQLYLEQEGLTDRYQVISSGTSVDDILHHRYSFAMAKRFIDMALNDERGIYEDSLDKDALRKSLEDPEAEKRFKEDPVFKEVVMLYLERAVDFYQAQETEHRFEALKDLGLEGKLKQTQDQTVARDEVIACFPVTKQNLSATKDIYKKAEKPEPFILTTPKSFATGNVQDEIPDAFGKPAEVYHKMIRALRWIAPVALGKAIVRYESRYK